MLVSSKFISNIDISVPLMKMSSDIGTSYNYMGKFGVFFLIREVHWEVGDGFRIIWF